MKHGSIIFLYINKGQQQFFNYEHHPFMNVAKLNKSWKFTTVLLFNRGKKKFSLNSFLSLPRFPVTHLFN